jgi:hypothetical protein
MEKHRATKKVAISNSICTSLDFIVFSFDGGGN